MCKAVENYANELAEERAKVLAEELAKEYIEKAVRSVKMMMNDGVSIEKALKYAHIDHQTYEKYSKNMQ